MKTITIAGNIGKDAVTRNTQGGESVTGWSVAVEERSGGDRRTLWFDVSLWGKRGIALAPYLVKGGKVAVSGELSTREHDGKTYLTVRADQVTLLGSKGDGARDDGPSERPHAQGGGGSTAPPSGGVPDLDDEVPFAPEVRA